MPTISTYKLGACTGNQADRSTEGGWAPNLVWAKNGGGIFAGWLYTMNNTSAGNDPGGNYRVDRSTDGGRTFKKIYDSATDGLIAHHLCTVVDNAGTVYVFVVWYTSTNANGLGVRMHTFTNPGYGEKRLTFGFVGSSKFSANYDPAQDKLLLQFWNGVTPQVRWLNLDGSAFRTTNAIYKPSSIGGESIATQYPASAMGAGGLVVDAWTTVDNTIQPNLPAHTTNYYGCHFVTSADGGQTWNGKNGAIGSLPMPCANDGPAWMIPDVTNGTEFTSASSGSYGPSNYNRNFMMSICVNKNHVNALYNTDQFRHMAFNLTNNTVTHRQQFAIIPVNNGAFAQEPSCTGTLYLTGPISGRYLRTWSSDDGGNTWSVYATSTWTADFTPRYTHCARFIDTDDGLVIGILTDNGSTTTNIWFFSVTVPVSTGGGTAPANTVAPSVTGTPQQGQSLTAHAGTWTGTAPITYAYAWRSNGTLNGATGATYVLDATDVGDTISVTVTATSSVSSVAVTSATVGPVTATGTAPTNTATPQISGTTLQGQVLTTDNGTWSGSTPITYTYQWNRAGTPITSATSPSYTLAAADVGNTITVTATATNAFGTASKTSGPVGPVTATPPPPTPPACNQLPSITGTTQVGQTLTASPGVWSGTTPITYTYQWNKADVVINGATATTYVPADADAGATITITVTATNSVNSVQATSPAVGPVTNIPPGAPNFPTTGTLDGFQYVANPLPPANWSTSAYSLGGLRSDGSVAFSNIGDGTDGGALWIADACPTPPIEVFVDVTTIQANPAQRINLYWANTGAHNTTFYGYRTGFDNANGGQVIIDRIAGGGAGQHLATISNLGSLVNGNSIGMIVDGTATITAFRKQAGAWTALASIRDPTPLFQSAPPTPLQYVGVSTNDAAVRLDNFGGGSTAFPTTPILSTFATAANPLGPPWAGPVGTFAQLQAVGGVCKPNAAQSASVWEGTAWEAPPIQAFVDVVTIPANAANWAGLYWLNNIGAVDASHYHYRMGYVNANGGTVNVNRVAAGVTGVTLFAQSNVGPLSNGDGIGMQIYPSGQICLYHRVGANGTWTIIASQPDPSPLWKLSMVTPMRYIALGTNDAATVLDNFGGGFAGAAPAAPSIVSLPALISV